LPSARRSPGIWSFSTLHTNDAIGGINATHRHGRAAVSRFVVGAGHSWRNGSCASFAPPAPSQRSIHLRFSSRLAFPSLTRTALSRRSDANIAAITGYEGRAALFEICLVSPAIQDLISQGKSAEALRARALQEGMVPLRQDGWNRVIAGATTLEEVVRVTAADVDVLDE